MIMPKNLTEYNIREKLLKKIAKLEEKVKVCDKEISKESI